jgi:catechol 2,3-dioxygenase-like lactoylglutathione lyase family enzyme
VLYSERVEACRDFYASLGLDLLREQHGGGPVHYAAELPDGLVLEIYPGSPGRSTGRLRLGLVVPATAQLPKGEHKVTDPDGRVVVVNAVRGALRAVAGPAPLEAAP